MFWGWIIKDFHHKHTEYLDPIVMNRSAKVQVQGGVLAY